MNIYVCFSDGLSDIRFFKNYDIGKKVINKELLELGFMLEREIQSSGNSFQLFFYKKGETVSYRKLFNFIMVEIEEEDET